MTSIASKFILNSDYPVDKLVLLEEGSMTDPSVGADGYTRYKKHIDIPAKCVVFSNGVFSEDKDFKAFDRFGVSFSDDVVEGSTIDSYINEDSSTARVTLSIIKKSPASSVLYYRIWGVIREDENFGEEFDYTYNKRNSLMIDTDLNYPALVKEGIAHSGDVVKHNLGEIPFCDVWIKPAGVKRFQYLSDDSLLHEGSMGQGLTRTWLKISKDSLTFAERFPGQPGDDEFYYRIYYS